MPLQVGLIRSQEDRPSAKSSCAINASDIKLQPDAAVLSSSLAASLGRPAPGTDLAVYPWPAAAQPTSQVQPSCRAI